MTRHLVTLLLLSTSITVAAECDRNIPGHLPNRFDLSNNDGTAFDKVTGLTWMRCHNELTWDANTQTCAYNLDNQGLAITAKLSWPDALLAAAQANTDSILGFSDWRLPNIKEIASLQDLGCDNIMSLTIDDKIFLLPSNVAHWSSTPTRLKIGEAVSSPYAWAYDFKAGSLGAFSTDIVNLYVIRLVRGNSQ